MEGRIGPGRRLRYWLDNMTSRGTKAMIAMLFFITMLLVVIVALFVTLSGVDPDSRGVLEVSWAGLMRTMDPGTMGDDQGPVLFLLAMLVITVGGIFVVGALIGIITTGIDSKLDKLRKGKSFVAQRDHTIILGWSGQIFSVLTELIEANANQKNGCIAILAEKDKVEMEDEIRSRITSFETTRVVCRTGSPIELLDLEIVNHRDARSIIILPRKSGDPDSCVIKSLLALVNNPDRRKKPYHIVGVLMHQDNLKVAEMVGREEAELILAGDLIARISAQTCRQSGLSMIYTELLSFKGDEIYFKDEPALVGASYSRAIHSYDDSALIGIRRSSGDIHLNPSADTLIESGDMVIAISEDDDTILMSEASAPAPREDLIVAAPPPPEVPEKTLILGWNRRVPIIVREMDSYVSPGSFLRIVADESVLDPSSVEKKDYSNLTVETVAGCTTDRRLLDGLHLEDYDHVIVQSYSDILDIPEADARTLITLLHLRNIRETGNLSFSIVSEVLDDRDRELAEVTHSDDFIVSGKLVSLMLTQVSENVELKNVFGELFDTDGSEIYLKPVELYVRTDETMDDFHTVLEAASRRGETAIGYRTSSGSLDGSVSVILNPRKSDPVRFARGDRIIVLAED